MYNIGSEVEITNLGLAHSLIRIFADERKEDADAAIERDILLGEDRALNDRRYAVDCRKLLALGWRPKMDFQQGIRKTSTYMRRCSRRITSGHNAWVPA